MISTFGICHNHRQGQIEILATNTSETSKPAWKPLSGTKKSDGTTMGTIDRELLAVIKDFLEMGHVDNIVAMFNRDHSYYEWTGAILDDERFNVRLGVLVLFEELKKREPQEVDRATRSLLPLLESNKPLIRGEALSVLGIIGSAAARAAIIAKLTDRHHLVREVAEDILSELPDE